MSSNVSDASEPLVLLHPCTSISFTGVRLTFFAVVAVLIAGAGCGREPTDPSRTNIAGVWQSFDRDLYIRNIRMVLVETRPGLVAGRWAADGKVDNACPPVGPCRDSSNIIGRNEVSQVVLHLLGAGDFVGERPRKDLLRGIIRSQQQNFHVTFTAVP